MIGWAVRQAAVWLFVMMGVYVLAHGVLQPRIQSVPAGPPVAPAAPPMTQAAVPNSAVYQSNRQGHVFVDAMVNGTPVHFLVDTGATFVSLTMADAEAAGFTRTELAFTGTTSTANGVARVAPVRLREVRLGEFAAGNVPAVVGEHLGMSLLGQSFLNRLSGYQMRDGVLTLTWN